MIPSLRDPEGNLAVQLKTAATDDFRRSAEAALGIAPDEMPPPDESADTGEEDEAGSPVESLTQGAGDLETGEPVEEPEEPGTEPEPPLTAKSRTKRRFDKLLAEKQTQEVELAQLRAQLARPQVQQSPPVVTPPAAPAAVANELVSLRTAEQEAARECNRLRGNGADESEQQAAYQRWQDARDRRRDEELLGRARAERQAEVTQLTTSRLETRLNDLILDIHTRHKVLVQTPTGGVDLNYQSPAVIKAFELAAADGVAIQNKGTLTLYLSHADRALAPAAANQIAAQARKAQQQAREMAARTGIEAGGNRSLPVSSTGKSQRIRQLEKAADSGDVGAARELMRLALSTPRRRAA